MARRRVPIREVHIIEVFRHLKRLINLELHL